MKNVGGRGYALELRERIVERVGNGYTIHDTARHFSVHPTTVERYQALDQQGQLGVVLTSPGRPRRVTALDEVHLLRQVDEHPDATLLEHAGMLEAATGRRISGKTVDRVFARHGITHKKNAGRQRTP